MSYSRIDKGRPSRTAHLAAYKILINEVQGLQVISKADHVVLVLVQELEQLSEDWRVWQLHRSQHLVIGHPEEEKCTIVHWWPSCT